MAVGQKNFTQKKPDQLVYLELGPGNGGVLLTLSEDGFRFRAVSPIRVEGTIPFAFSLDGRNRLEGAGVIEDLEEDGKSGGMRFTEVSEEFRSHPVIQRVAKSVPLQRLRSIPWKKFGRNYALAIHSIRLSSHPRRSLLKKKSSRSFLSTKCRGKILPRRIIRLPARKFRTLSNLNPGHEIGFSPTVRRAKRSRKNPRLHLRRF